MVGCVCGTALMWIHAGVRSAWQESRRRQCSSLAVQWGDTRAGHALMDTYCIHVESELEAEERQYFIRKEAGLKKWICQVVSSQQQPATQIWTHRPGLLSWKGIKYCVYQGLSGNRWFTLMLGLITTQMYSAQTHVNTKVNNILSGRDLSE